MKLKESGRDYGTMASSARSVVSIGVVSALRRAVQRGPSPATLLDARDRVGLHPLVVPLYASECGARVTGVIPARAPNAPDEWIAVETCRSPKGGARSLKPLGSVRSLMHRLVAEAHARAHPEWEQMAAEADAAEPSPPLFNPRDEVLGKLGLDRYLLMRAGAFVDIWERLSLAHLQRGDQTAASIAAERCTELNPGWGCALWAQAQLAIHTGRAEEARDLALAALFEPLDTLGVDLVAARSVARVPAELLVSEYRDQVKTGREGARGGSPDAEANPAQLAAERAASRLDDAVERGVEWDDFDVEALARDYDAASSADRRSAVLAFVARGLVEAIE